MPHLPRGLNARIILTVTCVLFATGAVSGWITARQQAETLLATMRAHAMIVVENVAESSAHYLLVSDYAELEEFLLKTAELADIRRLVVCEPDGSLLWDVQHRPGEPPHATTGIARIALPSSQTPSVAIENDLLSIWQPVMAGTRLGWLRAEFSLSSIREAQSRIWMLSLLLAFSWVVCSAFLVVVILRPLVRSIARLATFAAQLDSHKGSQISMGNQPSEITGLADSLNGASLKLLETERQLIAEKERLRESEAMYRSLVTSMAEGVMFQTADGVITAVNPSAELIWGCSAAQLIGRNFDCTQWNAIREDGTPIPGELFPARVTLGTGEPHHDAVMGIYRPDGTLVWISMNTQPLTAPGETVPYAVVATFHDITERKRYDEALHMQTVELEEEVAERQMAQESLQENALLLEEEIEKRQKVQEELEKLNAELEQRVRERTAELEEKNAELHKMNRLFVGRELRMVELKERIRELERQRLNPEERMS